jgi:hypothetical protein
MFDLQKRIESKRKHERMRKFIISFSVVIMSLIVAWWIVCGILAFKIIQDPEMIGNWIHRLIEGSR